MSESDAPEEPPQTEGKTWIAAALAFYGLALVVEWIVLDWREEFDDLEVALLSGHEAGLVPVIGMPCALIGAAFTAACSRRLGKVRAIEEKFAHHCADTSDVALAMLSVLCAVSEGLVVRFWIFQWQGFLASVAIAVVMALGPGVWALWPLHLGLALLLTGVVEAGLGLLPAMLAHALILYWSLRRILVP